MARPIAPLISLLAISAVVLGAVSYQIGPYTVVNYTGLVDVFKPTYVFKLDNCDVYVYVAKTFNDSTPMLSRLEDLIPPIKSVARGVDINKLFDAVLKLPGDAEVTVSIYGVGESDRIAAYIEIAPGTPGYKIIEHVKTRASNYTELVKEVGEKLGVSVYKTAGEVRESLKKAFSRGESAKAAYVEIVRKKLGSTKIEASSEGPIVLIKTTNLTEALNWLSYIGKELGEEIPAYIRVGAYWFTEELGERLRNAAMRWEREIGTVKKLEGGVAGIIHIFLLSQDLGPAYFVFPYVNGTPPDEETAKRLISRYVELAGVCPSPLIVEFWPKTGVDYLIVKPDYRVFILPAVAAAVTIIVALFIARRIKKSARKG
ncbi:hypothetical protein PAE3011 [Pyrobaculum aerophilum str. IM2]|uniref:Uncharacterized protein n=2 Tax=Pyrobaculum aerophilum TaxID=13773 RepID=Q8ZTZ8_PYRAE|nr:MULTISPECIES: hypothetical protein [Pyrobaculum]AAL64611.1 hypothetical protein PAE3011 [Pyrobaculum aerophilum str. IM2]HII46130.1 hypothetical protein [Pyrobaculum aerophilum]